MMPMLFPNFVNGDNIGMVQAGCSFRFHKFEAGKLTQENHLHRHDAAPKEPPMAFLIFDFRLPNSGPEGGSHPLAIHRSDLLNSSNLSLMTFLSFVGLEPSPINCPK